MTDRTFTTKDTFNITNKHGYDCTFFVTDDNVNVEVDCGPNEWGQFNLTSEEFQALFDWAKTNGFVK